MSDVHQIYNFKNTTQNLHNILNCSVAVRTQQLWKKDLYLFYITALDILPDLTVHL